MPLQIDVENLRRLMEDFYLLSGVRMVLFDEAENEILSYPEQGVPFCREMRKDPRFLARCKDCDRTAFHRCRQTESLTLYRCHAGLMEAAAPLMEEGKMIGYLMFGQVGSGSTRLALTKELTALCAEYGKEPTEVHSVAIRSRRRILACAKILEACTGYIRLRSYAVSQRSDLLSRLEEYVRAHLEEDCSVAALCRALSVSRSVLYRLFPSGSGGVASFVRNLRLREAERLLLTTTLSSAEIAHRTGFSDGAYFCRLFRQERGQSVRDFRKQKDEFGKLSRNS